MKKLRSFLALASLLAVSAAAQDYAIKIHQPLKAGQRYKLTTVARQSTTNSVIAHQKILKNEKDEYTIEFESVVTVLEVDAIGRPTKQSHIVVKLVKVKDSTKEPMLAAGTKVVAFRTNKKKVFEVDDKPVSLAVAKVLDSVVSVTLGGPSEDEIVGTTERKKVGDSWSIDEEQARKDFEGSTTAQELSMGKTSGKTTLVKVTKDGDVDVLHLMSSMTAKLSPVQPDPLGSADVTAQATMTGAFPSDISNSVVEQAATMTMTMKASRKSDANGLTVQMIATSKWSANSKTKLLK